MKNFVLGYFAIHLGGLAIGSLFVSHGGAEVLLLGAASGFASVVLWQAMDIPKPEPKGSIRRPD